MYFFKIFFIKTFFQNFFQIFSRIFFFQNFFFFIFFLKIFFQNFFPKSFLPTSFQNLFFEGFTLDALPFTETKRTLCICVMKNMIHRPIYEFRLQHTKFSVFRLILRPGNHTTLSFKIQNLNSKFKFEILNPVKIRNSKSRSEIQNFSSMHTLILRSNI